MKLTIVTITKDNYEELFHTVDSIHKTYNNDNDSSQKLGEIVIVDGSNNPVAIERDEILSSIVSSDLELKILQEKDSGIYDAMNKGIISATCEFLQFVNSGDELLELLDVSTMKHASLINSCAGVATDALIKFGKISLKRKAVDVSLNSRPQMPAIHQALIYKRSVLSKIPFSTSYKICGDFENTSLILNSGYHFQSKSIITASLSSGGISSTKPITLFRESRTIQNLYFRSNLLRKYFYQSQLIISIIIYLILFRLSSKIFKSN